MAREIKINYSSDPVEFDETIRLLFGTGYYHQTRIFFERATDLAKDNLLQSALDAGEFALELSRYSSRDASAEFIAGFLAQLSCDLGLLGKAVAYWRLGRKLLDPSEPDYPENRAMFDNLKRDIEEAIRNRPFDGNT